MQTIYHWLVLNTENPTVLKLLKKLSKKEETSEYKFIF